MALGDTMDIWFFLLLVIEVWVTQMYKGNYIYGTFWCVAVPLFGILWADTANYPNALDPNLLLFAFYFHLC